LEVRSGILVFVDQDWPRYRLKNDVRGHRRGKNHVSRGIDFFATVIMQIKFNLFKGLTANGLKNSQRLD